MLPRAKKPPPRVKGKQRRGRKGDNPVKIRAERKAEVEEHLASLRPTLQHHASGHHAYMQGTVAGLSRSLHCFCVDLEAEVDKRRLVDKGLEFNFREMLSAFQEHCADRRQEETERLQARLTTTKDRLDEMKKRLPEERRVFLEAIDSQTSELREKIRQFIAVEMAEESATSKQRHQRILGDVGNAAIVVEDQLAECRRRRELATTELQDKLEAYAATIQRNRIKIRDVFETQIANLKNAAAEESLLRQESDKELSAIMRRYFEALKKGAEVVNSRLGLEEYDVPQGP